MSALRAQIVVSSGQCSHRHCTQKSVRSELCDKHYKVKYSAVRPMSRVYAIWAPDICPPLVKFGFSCRPRERLSDCRSSSPVPLKLLGHVPGARKLEYAIHKYLSEYRSHGEWFEYSGDAKYLAELITDGRLSAILAIVFGEKPSFEDRLAEIDTEFLTAS